MVSVTTWYLFLYPYSGNKLMQNKGQINVKRGLNSDENHELNLTTISP